MIKFLPITCAYCGAFTRLGDVCGCGYTTKVCPKCGKKTYKTNCPTCLVPCGFNFPEDTELTEQKND